MYATGQKKLGCRGGVGGRAPAKNCVCQTRIYTRHNVTLIFLFLRLLHMGLGVERVGTWEGEPVSSSFKICAWGRRWAFFRVHESARIINL